MVINGVTLNPDQYDEPGEAAQALGMKAQTLATHRCRPGTIPFTKLGRRVRYRGADLIAHITDATKQPGADPVRSEAAKASARARHTVSGRAA